MEAEIQVWSSLHFKQQKEEKQLLHLCGKGYRGVVSVGAMGARAHADFRIAL